MSKLFPEIPHPSQRFTSELLQDERGLFENNQVLLRTAVETNFKEYVDETEGFFNQLDTEILLVLVTELGYGLVRPDHIPYAQYQTVRGEMLVIQKGDETITKLLNTIKERNTNDKS